MDRATRNGGTVGEEPIDGPVKVIDRRRWAHGEPADGEAPRGKPAYVEELERQLAEKDAAIQAAASRYRASAAEFESVRARLRRDVDKEVERARRAVLYDTLEIVDNLDRAIAAARQSAGGDDALLKGVELVRSLLLARLASYGVRPIAAEGARFDPTVHDAMSAVAVADQAQDGQVVGVIRTGYTVGEDVLRPAGVVVGRFEA